MPPRIRIMDLDVPDLDGGYLIDGFPSVGFSSAIATESMIHTSKFELAGIIDSNIFPPISIIKDAIPNYPTRIFANRELKIAVFLSYLTLDETLHRTVARAMFKWARQYRIGTIVSSVAVRSPGMEGKVVGVGSTESARKKITDSGLEVLKNGTVPGIPGRLLNEGCLTNQDVVVIIVHTDADGSDFKSSTQLCIAMSQIIPGASCNMPSLQQEAEKAEVVIKETDKESRHLKDSMYR